MLEFRVAPEAFSGGEAPEVVVGERGFRQEVCRGGRKRQEFERAADFAGDRSVARGNAAGFGQVLYVGEVGKLVVALPDGLLDAVIESPSKEGERHQRYEEDLLAASWAEPHLFRLAEGEPHTEKHTEKGTDAFSCNTTPPGAPPRSLSIPGVV